MVQDIDPIRLEVMRNALYSVTDEMVAALVRTAYSTNIKDRRDCSCAVYTPAGEVAAQSEVGTPLHLGVMPAVVSSVLKGVPISDMEPGDHIVMNQPYPAGPGHLNDISVVSPVFADGKVVALVASMAHHVDVGGYAPGSMAFGTTEIFQEGIQIPPVKIVKRHQVDKELLAFMLANVRLPVVGRGDLMAQVAANNVGGQRLIALMDKYGAETVARYMAALMDYSERRMRAGIGEMPKGRYSFEDYLEWDDEMLIPIRVAVEIGDDELLADFTGTSPQVEGPLNCRRPTVEACVYYVAKCLVDPGLPPNAGVYRPIEVVAPDGSLVSASYPASVVHSNIVTTQRIVDVLLGAFLKAVPERVQAASSGTENLVIIGGPNPRTGSYFSYVETYGGGQGASFDMDGMSGVHTHMTNTRNAPLEVMETSYPLRVERYGLVPDSEGAGKYRGGFGMVREVTALADASLTLSSDRHRLHPWGVDSGLEASGARCILTKPDGSVQELPVKLTTRIHAGERIATITPGGGGWGDPRERDHDLVASDVQEGLISQERAETVYGFGS